MELRRFLRLKPYVGMYRRMDITPLQTLRGRRDDDALRERMPAMTEYDALATVSRDRLAAHHARYIASVSTDIMAASLELSTFLDVFCTIGKPAKVVDLGSGFSSWVLRSYAASADPSPEVHSVDDHEGWLERTRAYLEAQGVRTDNLWHWPAFISSVEPGSFDLVLHDMGSMEFRASSLPQVLTLARPGGHVVLDDVHKPDYRKHVEGVLAEHGLEYLSLKRITCDNKARYAFLVFK